MRIIAQKIILRTQRQASILWHNENGGASAVEFAVVAPMLFYLIFFALELSLMLGTALVVEQTMYFVSRDVKVDRGADGAEMRSDLESKIKDDIINRSYGLLHRDKLKIFTSTTASAQLNTLNGGLAAANTGAVVSYTTEYCWRTITPGLAGFAGLAQTNTAAFCGGGEFGISSSMVLINE